jgi:outer membrane protein insertion porin family
VAIFRREGILTLAILARREVFLSPLKLIVVAYLFLPAAQVFATQQPQENSQTKYFIECINIVGNRRVETGTVLTRISSRSGDSYSVEGVRRDVQALWNTQFFDQLRLEVEDSPTKPNGKIVIFTVIEKPVIGRIEYKGIQSISEADIRGALKDEKAWLLVGSWFDQKKLKHAVVVISELLSTRGHQFATVKPTYEENSSTNAVTLVFNIDEGPKAQTLRNHS